jgi:hypothetical protein
MQHITGVADVIGRDGPGSRVDVGAGAGQFAGLKPWFCRRLELLDFDQGLVGPFRSVEDVLKLCGWYVLEVAV